MQKPKLTHVHECCPQQLNIWNKKTLLYILSSKNSILYEEIQKPC